MNASITIIATSAAALVGVVLLDKGVSGRALGGRAAGGRITVKLSKVATSRSRMLGPWPWERDADQMTINDNGSISMTRDYANKLMAQSSPQIGGNGQDYARIKKAVYAYDHAAALALGASERDAAVVAGHAIEPWNHWRLTPKQRDLIARIG